MNKQHITPSSSPEAANQAFATMANTFRSMVAELCRSEGITFQQCVSEACGKDDFSMLDFLNGGSSIPTGISVDRILSYFSAQQRFSQEVPVVFSSALSYAKQVPIPHPGGAVPPEGFDIAASEVLSVTSWFYTQATKRALEKGL